MHQWESGKIDLSREFSNLLNGLPLFSDRAERKQDYSKILARGYNIKVSKRNNDILPKKNMA